MPLPLIGRLASNADPSHIARRLHDRARLRSVGTRNTDGENRFYGETGPGSTGRRMIVFSFSGAVRLGSFK
jgi:hypothetical protein